ncbi:MAG: hypothetical protein J6S82_10155 [Bacteroidales bacterium]|nr:hypothetical protein [Bacteroidales bacterium]
MGTIKKGILGGFHGKVGTVVGGSWKGVTYMRGMAPSIRNPRTEGQIRQRDKIRNVSAFLQVMLPVINVGYKNSAAKQSPYSAAMSHILKNAMSGDAVDYTRVLLSRGTLPNVGNLAATSDATSANISWSNTEGMIGASESDKIFAVGYNKDKGQMISDSNTASRTEESLDLNYPSGWDAGDKVEVYVFTFSADGNSISDSAFVAEVTITS